MKDLGQADVILGIKLVKTDKGIALTQSHYVEKMLRKFGYFDTSPVASPFDSSVKLRKNVGDSVSQHKYSQIIGSLLHLTNFSRPDNAYAVCRLARYTHNPSTAHWNALERVFRYLKGTMNYAIHYCGFPGVVEGYSDASWIADIDETKATSGYVFLLGGGAVSWRSAKQTIISRSTMEA
ncbi:secreted RxLR effector protein 161-like [Silene latifolia]|uniref:secreted RxLR effector protein 161-like n=1 Tax=Silene latifolia TaxID=37657 RepID=UPI003D78A144